MSPRPSPSRYRSNQGFTIVEVMMASVILVVGFLGMIQAVTIGSEMLATARRQTIANQIITHEVEKLRLKDWTSIDTLPDITEATYASDSAQLQASIDASGVSFKLAMTVASPTTDLREVTFTVKWVKSGTTTAAGTVSGSWLDRMAFYRPSVISRTYTRVSVAYFGRYGLNRSNQR